MSQWQLILNIAHLSVGGYLWIGERIGVGERERLRDLQWEHVCVCGSRRKEKESQLTKKTRDNREDTTLHSLVDRYTREGQAEGNEDLPRRRREGIGSL